MSWCRSSFSFFCFSLVLWILFLPRFLYTCLKRKTWLYSVCRLYCVRSSSAKFSFYVQRGYIFYCLLYVFDCLPLIWRLTVKSRICEGLSAALLPNSKYIWLLHLEKMVCFFFFMVTPLQPLLILSRTACVLTSGPFKSTSQLSDIQKQDFEEKPRNNTPAPNLPSHRSAHVSDGSGCKLAHRSEAASLMLHSLRSHPSSALLFSQSSFTLLFTIMSLSFMGFFLFSPNLYSPNCRSGFVDVRWKLTTRSVFNYITEGESWHSSVQLEKKNL